jgi:hypothetical protein
MVDFQSGSGIL